MSFQNAWAESESSLGMLAMLVAGCLPSGRSTSSLTTLGKPRPSSPSPVASVRQTTDRTPSDRAARSSVRCAPASGIAGGGRLELMSATLPASPGAEALQRAHSCGAMLVGQYREMLSETFGALLGLSIDLEPRVIQRIRSQSMWSVCNALCAATSSSDAEEAQLPGELEGIGTTARPATPARDGLARKPHVFFQPRRLCTVSDDCATLVGLRSAIGAGGVA